ncbi:ATP-dependent helicase HrpB [Mobilicoccus pelagius]|uniref:Putative ATP-dependent helicase n=1 Tax=Mobilicoccus pelagius NBRC 104925 TaxID=1089455 RepID=H5UR84_9MICO|nr:ATP-dependent helicase HrpB [Mobilicoccus pelagius]GAB48242.1 putative ATP-dependent helicase [Mobilicoccus pelagius NBRC 104925]
MTRPFDLARIGAGLPFAEALPALRTALGRGAVVVEAPAGTGKTTLVPPAAANEVPGRVVLTQPRRIAADAAARRLATLTGTAVGDLVGVTVRGRHDVGPRTRIEVVTPGVLLRRLLADPDLPGVDAVVLDEIHERGLDTDLLLGMLAEVRALREDLVLVAMSATLDARRFATLLDAEVVHADGVLHPLEVAWVPPPGPFADARGVTPEFLGHVAAVTAEAVGPTSSTGAAGAADSMRAPGRDALVFLPGVREVDRVAGMLAGRVGGAEVLTLHGGLPLAEQHRVTGGRGPADPPRVVVTTALAESSLTVPGVGLVVDAGLSREPRRDAARGMTGLVTVRCSQDAATQRAGRAAREGPGRVVRCYDERTWAAMPTHVTPEVASSDLTGAALTLAVWGAPGGDGLALPDPLPEAALADAVATLADLGAVDGDGRATDVGRRLALVPADPRWARALLDGARRVGVGAAADVVAMLADDHRPEGADLTRLLTELRSGRHRGSGRWRQESARLHRVATARRGGKSDGPPPERTVAGPAAPGVVVALARPEWVARRRGDSYLLAAGTRASLPPRSPLAGQEWLAIADVSRVAGRVADATGAVVRAAAPLTEEAAIAAAAPLLREEERCVLDDGRILARRVRRLGAIELTATPTTPTPVATADAWRDGLARAGLGVLPWTPAATALRRRLAFCRRHLGDPWPDVTDDALLGRLADWFDLTATRVADVDLHSALQARLPWPEAAGFDELAPERLVVADGTRARVEYPEVNDPEGRPVVAVRLQSCFGMTETPRLADGRVPVLFHLLSPARRPLAVTDDLASFWAGPYAQVRAEMRGRYPKHPWPQRPS